MKTYLLTVWKWLSHNFGLKLLAVFSAFVIWISVVNTQDPIDTVSFYNVPVEILNEQALIQKDKIPEVVYGSTVSVTVQARKHICDALTVDSIKATADFEKIYVTDTVPIEIRVLGYDESEVEIIRGQNNYMKLTLEDYATKEFKVKINTVGTPANGYVVGTSSASPNVITIRGSKLQLSRIQGVIATVSVDGLTRGTEVVVRPVVYDMNDEVINNGNLELSAGTVSVSTTLYRTRTINLEAVLLGEVAEGYEVKSVSSQPSTITVAGTAEDLARLGMRLRAYVDVTGLSANGESNIDIGSLIDSRLSSIMILEDDTTLAVTVYVEEQGSSDLVITPNDVEIDNLSEDLKARVTSLSFRRLSVRAKKDVLAGLSVSAVRPHIDLSGITSEGIYDVPLLIDEINGIKGLTEIAVRVEVTSVAPPEPKETEAQ